MAYLKASNPEAEDHFGCGGVLDGHAGWGVAISGDGTTLAVGAPHESSGAKGVNGNQNDNSMYGSGAGISSSGAARDGRSKPMSRRQIPRWAPSSVMSLR